MDRDCENCKHHREVHKNGKFYRFCESWDCGFEPKEYEPFEPCEDAISRREAISIAGIATLSVNQVVTALKKLPPVNPQKPICPSEGVDPAYEKTLNKWIGAEVLDKIRAEIDEQYDRVHPYDISCAEGLEMALNIVDKYIAEEDKA